MQKIEALYRKIQHAQKSPVRADLNLAVVLDWIESEHAALDYLSNHRSLSAHEYMDYVRLPAHLHGKFVAALYRIGTGAADLKAWQRAAANRAKAEGSARRMAAQRNAEYLRLPPRQAWKLLGEGLYSPAIWTALDQMIDAGA